MFWAAVVEFSAFFLVMEWISSLEAEVSWRLAACSEELCANDWLEEATWDAAPEI